MQNTDYKSGLRVDIRRLLGYFSKYRIKCSVFFFFFFFFFFHLLYVITKNPQYARKSKLYTTFEAEIIILEIKFYKGAKRQGRMGKWAKRLRGERESRQNDPGAKRLGVKGKVGKTTRGRTGKWAKRPGFMRTEKPSITIKLLNVYLHENKETANYSCQVYYPISL